MKSSCRCSKGPEGGLKLLGPKPVLQDYDLCSRIVVVGYFFSAMEVFSPMSIHNLSHFKCIRVGERMQNQKMGFARKLGRTKQVSWVSH